MTAPADPAPKRARVPEGLVSKVLILLAAFTAIIIGVGFALPDRYVVERAVVVEAPPARVYARVADLNGWAAWQPWARRDGEATFTVEGAPGPGQTLRWDGPDLGQGRIEVTGLRPDAAVDIALTFREGGPRPTGVIALQASGGATRVVWRIEGETTLRPIGNYLGLLMDGIIGPDLDAGLAGLKRAVGEAPAQ